MRGQCLEIDLSILATSELNIAKGISSVELLIKIELERDFHNSLLFSRSLLSSHYYRIITEKEYAGNY